MLKREELGIINENYERQISTQLKKKIKPWNIKKWEWLPRQDINLLDIQSTDNCLIKGVT